MNTPIQGTAADIMKLAMIEVSRRIKEEGYKSRVLLQVHDELVVEAVSEEKENLKTLFKRNYGIRCGIESTAHCRCPRRQKLGRSKVSTGRTQRCIELDLPAV